MEHDPLLPHRSYIPIRLKPKGMAEGPAEGRRSPLGPADVDERTGASNSDLPGSYCQGPVRRNNPNASPFNSDTSLRVLIGHYN